MEIGHNVQKVAMGVPRSELEKFLLKHWTVESSVMELTLIYSFAMNSRAQVNNKYFFKMITSNMNNYTNFTVLELYCNIA